MNESRDLLILIFLIVALLILIALLSQFWISNDQIMAPFYR